MCLAGDRPGVASGKSHFCWKRMAMMKPLSREATKWAHVTIPISRIVYMTPAGKPTIYRAKNSRKKLAGVHFVKPGTRRCTGKGEVQSEAALFTRRSTPSDFSRILKASPPIPKHLSHNKGSGCDQQQNTAQPPALKNLS